MNPTVILVIAIAVIAFYLGSRFYGRRIERHFDVSSNNRTPAHTQQDGRDFIPAKSYVLFAHHFAAIAGAGPIIGPTLGVVYGIVPCLLWVILGAIFLGGVQDLSTAIMSLRERGESIAAITRKVLGPWGYALMVGFMLVGLFMINATFLNLSVTALTSTYPAEKVNLPVPPQEALANAAAQHPNASTFSYDAHAWMPTTVQVDTSQQAPTYTLMARIGGIASTSVLIITLLAPLVGWMIYRRKYLQWLNYGVAFLICVGSVMIGLKHPVLVTADTWRMLLTIYVALASTVPVWLLLMPRDFINVQILYGGIAALFGGLIIVAFLGPIGGIANSAPAAGGAPISYLNLTEGMQYMGMLWPLLFITISCGAISGFHCLVSTGTSAKQMSCETHARPVIYNAMLLEGLLATAVILTLYLGLAHRDYLSIAYGAGGGGANPVLAIALATGNLLHQAFSLPVWFGAVIGILLLEGFIVTTLDAAVRLARYLLQELWRTAFANPPAWLTNAWLNTAIVVIAMFVLSRSNTLPVLWRIFGTANQMMGALALLIVALWMHAQGRRYLFALIPSLIMFATTLTSAFLSLKANMAAANWPLTAACIFLISLSLGMLSLGGMKFYRNTQSLPTP